MAEVRYSILTYLRVGVPKVASLTPIRFFVFGTPSPLDTPRLDTSSTRPRFIRPGHGKKEVLLSNNHTLLSGVHTDEHPNLEAWRHANKSPTDRLAVEWDSERPGSHSPKNVAREKLTPH